MTTRDLGLEANGLRVFTWGLAALAAFAWLMLFVVLAGDDPGAVTSALWAVLGLVTTVASAACAVLCGVKNAEYRLAERLQSRV